jgi:peptidoglycan/LPS O-acetylase OafA/YrhL
MTSYTKHLSHPKYRPDIDGLRAIAVLSVVAFHAFPSWVKGGFVGVDVFFVISGYLISTIIFENLDKGTFSFAEFYVRRIKRIFPALILVLIASYTFGWFALLADEYKQLGKHIAAGAGFVSNIVLWNEAGYFDNSAETKPLLHLWSLGIEEQFYIVWPFLLWLAWRRNFNLFTITIVVAVVSFYLNVKGVHKDAIATFYSPQTRFWELLCGSLLAWATLYKKDTLGSIKAKLDGWLAFVVCRKAKDGNGKTLSNALSFLGLFLLAYGFYRINKDFSFPGKWAVVPVLGAILIIFSEPNAWGNRTILSNPIAVWFGLISFPLYLWHWPLLSFARIIESEVPSRGVRIGAVLLAIVLAWLTYKFVERPIRLGKHSKVKTTALVVLMLVVGYVGYNTYDRGGLEFRTKNSEEFISYYENSFPTWKYFNKINLSKQWRSECAFFNGRKYLAEGQLEGGVTDSKPVDKLDASCYERDPRFEKSVLIWGDSHAQALSPGVVNNIPKTWQVLQVASSGCNPNPNIETPSVVSQCNQSNFFAIRTIEKSKPDVVVVAQARGHSVKSMKDITEKLRTLGVRKILFLGPTPEWTADLPKIIARQLWITKPKRTLIGINQDILKSNEQLLREFTPSDVAEYVDVIGFFCDANGCLTYTGSNAKDTLTTWDYGHLTPSASDFLSKNFLVKKIIVQ